MPRALASLGPCTVTGRPSKRYSPESNAWMPATPLIRVLLPAPLSPTRAVTWPARTSRSTPRSTWTAPKLFSMPRRLRIGCSRSTGAGSVWVALMDWTFRFDRQGATTGAAPEKGADARVVWVPAPRGAGTHTRGSADAGRRAEFGELAGADD